MKNTKLIFMGMLAILLAFGLVFTSCEGPTGPAGIPGGVGAPGADGGPGTPGADAAANLKQAEELATYGFSFGTPIHNAVGRDAVYPAKVLSNVRITGLKTVGAVTKIDAGDSFTAGNVIIVYENKSAQFTTTDGGITWGDFAKALTEAASRGGFSNVKAEIVDYPGNSTTASPVIADSVLQITRPTTGELYILVGNGLGDMLFNNSGEKSGFAVTSGTPDRIDFTPSIDGVADKWTVPVLTSIVSATNSAPAKVTLGSVVQEFPKKVDFTDSTGAVNIIATKFTDADAKAIPGYNVAPLGVASTYNGNGLVFTAAAKGVSTKLASDFLPVISGYDGYKEWGYAVTIKHTTEGKDAAATVTPAYNKWGNVAASNAAVAKDWITIKVKDSDGVEYWDTTIFNAALYGGPAVNSLAVGDLNTLLTDDHGGVFEYTPFGTASGPDALTFTLDSYAVGNFFTIESSNIVKFHKIADGKAASATATTDIWTITIAGTAGIDDFNPTKASKLTFVNSGTGLTFTGSLKALVEANNTPTVIASNIAGAFGTISGGAGYTATPGAGVVTIEAGGSGAANAKLKLKEGALIPTVQ